MNQPGQSMIQEEVSEIRNRCWHMEGLHIGYSDLVVNLDTQVKGEQFTIPHDGRFTKEELQLYQIRKEAHPHVVRVLDLYREDSQGLCSFEDVLVLVTERVPYRLNEVMGLNYWQSLYILYKCLQAMKWIVTISQPVLITEKMIGIDESGCVKMWINENYASNKPDTKLSSEDEMKSVYLMVCSLLDILKENLTESLVNEIKRTHPATLEKYTQVVVRYAQVVGLSMDTMRVEVIKATDSLLEGRIGTEIELYSITDNDQESVSQSVPLPVLQLMDRLFQGKIVDRKASKASSSERATVHSERTHTTQRQISEPKLSQNLTSMPQSPPKTDRVHYQNAVEVSTATKVSCHVPCSPHSQPTYVQQLTPREYQKRLSQQMQNYASIHTMRPETVRNPQWYPQSNYNNVQIIPQYQQYFYKTRSHNGYSYPQLTSEYLHHPVVGGLEAYPAELNPIHRYPVHDSKPRQ